MTPEKAHFQENLWLNQNTPEQLEKLKNDLKVKIDTLKADGSFSGEDLADLVDLLDDKTILSPTEAELKSHLESLQNLETQINFLMALVDIGEESGSWLENWENQVLSEEELENLSNPTSNDINNNENSWNSVNEEFDKETELMVLEMWYEEIINYLSKLENPLNKDNLNEFKNFLKNLQIPINDIITLAERYNDKEKIDFINNLKNRIVEIETWENNIWNEIEYDWFKVMNDIEEKEFKEKSIENKVIDLIINLSKKDNITWKDLDILINELKGISTIDIKDYIKKENIPDNLKNLKIELIENFENKISKLPENERKEFDIVNYSINYTENAIENLNLDIKYKKIEYWSEEYMLKAKKILNSPIFQKNEMIHEFFSLLSWSSSFSFLEWTTDKIWETIWKEDIYNVLTYLTNLLKWEVSGLNFDDNWKIELIKKEDLRPDEIEDQKNLIKETIKTKEDVYLIKLWIKLLTPPEKYEEITKIFYQEINDNENLKKLPESENYKIINENSKFIEKDNLVQEKYKQLKNNLTKEKVEKLWWIKDFKKISKNEIEKAKLNIDDKNLNDILNWLFTKNWDLNLEFWIENAFNIIKSDKKIENKQETFKKLIDIINWVAQEIKKDKINKISPEERKTIEDNIKTFKRSIEELLQKEFEDIPDSAKKYFKRNERWKYIFNIVAFYNWLINDKSFSKKDISRSWIMFWVHNITKDIVEKFLTNIWIKREENEDLYLSSLQLLVKNNQLKVSQSKLWLDIPDKLDWDAIYKHLESWWTYSSYIEKIQQEKLNSTEKNSNSQETQNNSTNYSKDISSWEYTLDTSNSVIKTESWKNISLNQEEINMIQKNPDTMKNIINLYESLERVWLTKLWNYKEDIFKSLENVFRVQFDRKDGNYLDERETKILLNAVLTSLWEKPIKTDKKIDNFLSEVENINWRQVTWTEKEVNKLWESRLEASFIEKFVWRWDMIWFKQSAFEDSLKKIN